MRVIAAHINRHGRIAVTLEGNARTPFIETDWEERGGYYRAQYGDLIQYFAYDGPGRGFGGAKFDIVMSDGEKRTLIGPWSSSSGVINHVFCDREPVTECVNAHSPVVTCVNALRLIELSIPLTPWHRFNDEGVYWELPR